MWIYVTLIVLFLVIFGVGTWLAFRASNKRGPTSPTG